MVALHMHLSYSTRCSVNRTRGWFRHPHCIAQRPAYFRISFRPFHEYYSHSDEEPGLQLFTHVPEPSRLRLLSTKDLTFAKRPRRRGQNKSLYAILSHTWRENGDEITYDDLLQKDRNAVVARSAWDKVNYTSKQARQDDLEFFWIDSCCINKSSSAELSEAINSMYAWYANAQVCYVYLADHDQSSGWESFRNSRWFRRAWTLQELLAPPEVRFYDRFWNHIGSLGDSMVLENVSQATGIGVDILSKKVGIEDFSIAQRMSWASNRSATRIEDLAYSLLGIFDINMPMLYGEGPKAFVRLQEEIIRHSTDHSIFCWEHKESTEAKHSPRTLLLAPSPSSFAGCSDIVQRPGSFSTPYRMTNLGLEITLPLRLEPGGTASASLNCVRNGSPKALITLHLQCIFDFDDGSSVSLKPQSSKFGDFFRRRANAGAFLSTFAGRGFVVGPWKDRMHLIPPGEDFNNHTDFRSETIMILRNATRSSSIQQLSLAYKAAPKVGLLRRIISRLLSYLKRT